MVALDRLYAILDVDLTRARGLDPLDLTGIWLDAGLRVIQLRAKQLPGGAFLDLARGMQAAIGGAGGRFIVNDRADIAAMSGASGVHVGQDDLSPADVRRLVGASAVVGKSTHTPEQTDAACREPIAYVAIGPVFATRTKGATVDPAVGLAGVRVASARARQAGLPLVAIGGITMDNARSVFEAGADSVAVISDLLAGEPGERVRRFLQTVG